MILTASSVDSRGAECLPDYSFANVGSDEEGNTRSKAITFLKQFVKHQDKKTGKSELRKVICRKMPYLQDDEQADSSTEIAWGTVDSRHDVDGSLADSDNHTKH